MIRKAKPGTNELGGLTRVYVYKVSQFTLDVDFPTDADVATGEIAGPALPLKAAPDDKAAIIAFDVKEAEANSKGFVSVANFGYLHSLKGKVAGYTKEKHVEVAKLQGQDLMLVAKRPNGSRILLGQTYKPMRMNIDDTLGSGAESYVGSDITFEQVDAVSFRPPLLAAAIAITTETVVDYA